MAEADQCGESHLHPHDRRDNHTGEYEIRPSSISSLPPDDPLPVAEAVRSHWFIENALHWTLDVTFSEDHSRVRTGYAAENLALVRRLAVSLLKNDGRIRDSPLRDME